MAKADTKLVARKGRSKKGGYPKPDVGGMETVKDFPVKTPFKAAGGGKKSHGKGKGKGGVHRKKAAS